MDALNLNLIDLPTQHIEQLNEKYLRFYQQGGSKYPSVTTFLGHTADKTALYAWKKRVGAEEAKRVSQESLAIGKANHTAIENYCLHGTDSDLPHFQGFKKIEERITDIRMIEYPVINHKEQYAGTIDMFASYEGVPSVIDIKTSAKLKKPQYVRDYLLQTVSYAAAINRDDHLVKLLGKVQQCVIIVILAEHDSQIFKVTKEEILPLWKELLSRRNTFRKMTGY